MVILISPTFRTDLMFCSTDPESTAHDDRAATEFGNGTGGVGPVVDSGLEVPSLKVLPESGDGVGDGNQA